ncbi:hypothetical protein GCM10027570_07890 [Streptomonospora sediminis]
MESFQSVETRGAGVKPGRRALRRCPERGRLGGHAPATCENDRGGGRTSGAGTAADGRSGRFRLTRLLSAGQPRLRSDGAGAVHAGMAPVHAGAQRHGGGGRGRVGQIGHAAPGQGQ